MIVSHAAAPPWAEALRGREFPLPADDVAALDLDPQRFAIEVAEVRRRDAQSPDGDHAVLDDGLVVVRRIV